MMSTTILCFLIVLLSFTVNVNCQTCENVPQYGACSTNSGCGCLHLTVVNNVGVCGLLSLSCSRFSPCQSPSDSCAESDHICVRHPQCSSTPLCFPLAMVDQRLCPPLTPINTTRPGTTVISNCSGALTTTDGRYTRPGASGTYYYEAIQIMVGTSGTYNLTSLSGMDTHGYLYNGTFNPFSPTTNQIGHNDDGASGNQFLLTHYLEAGVPYTLVVTTHGAGITAPFSVVSSGPDDVFCIALDPVTTTTSTTTITTTTRAPVFNATYSDALTLNSSSYGRANNSTGTYYYQAIEVNVDTTGTYTFTSASGIDTYGYLYQGNFYPFYPSLNIVAQDDDAAGSGQFRLTANLRSDITYILVFTTYSERATTPYTVNASGPGGISLTPIN